MSTLALSTIPRVACPMCGCAGHGRSVLSDHERLREEGIEPAWLTPTERRLAAALLPPGTEQQGKDLIERAWGRRYAADPGRGANVLRTHLCRINSGALAGHGWRIEHVWRGTRDAPGGYVLTRKERQP